MSTLVIITGYPREVNAGQLVLVGQACRLPDHLALELERQELCEIVDESPPPAEPDPPPKAKPKRKAKAKKKP